MLPQEIPQELTLDALLEMDEAKAKEMLRHWGSSAEECSRLQQALTCLRKVTGLGKRCPHPPTPPVLYFRLCSQAWPVPLGDGTSAKVGLGIERGKGGVCFRVWGVVWVWLFRKYAGPWLIGSLLRVSRALEPSWSGQSNLKSFSHC